MKRKFLIILLTLLSVICCVAMFSACNVENSDGTGDTTNQTQQGGSDNTSDTDNKDDSQEPEKKTYDMSKVIFADKIVVYNGEQQSIFATNLPAGVTVAYDGNGKVDSGVYTVTAHFTGDEVNYNPIPDKTAKLTIEKAEYDMSSVVFSDFTVTYNNQPQSIFATNLPEGVTVTYDGNGKTNAGNYTVTAHFKGDEVNHKPIDDKTATLKIEKAEYDMSKVVFEDDEVSYDGEPHSLYARNVPEGITVTYDGNGQVEEGEHTVTAHFAGDSQNYKDIPDRKAKLSIVRDFYDIIYHFVGDGVENNNPERISRDAEETELLPLECNGYQFEGWCTDEARETILQSIPANPRQNYNLYAKWTSPFRIVDGTLYTLTPEGKNQSYLAINNGIEGTEVTKINEKAFSNSLATEIVLPDSVTEIGQNAFYNCGYLQNLTTPVATRPNSDAIYYNFGYYCGADNKSVESGLYQERKITFGVTYYVPKSFCNLTINAVTVGSFENFTMLKSVHFGKNVTQIDNSAFSGCANLSEISFENSNVQIGSSAFKNTALSSNETYWEYYPKPENWPSNQPYIEEDHYYGTYINNVLIQAGQLEEGGYYRVKPGTISISSGAFDTLKTSLNGIDIPDSVTSISNYAFDSCRNLTRVYITNLKTWCNIEFGSSDANPLYYAHNLYLNKELVTEITADMLQGITEIKDYAFCNCTSLESVTIGDSVTSIGNSAFYGCTSLESVTIGDSVTFIGDYAFEYCESLTGVYITNLAAWCNIKFSYYNANPLYCAHNLYLNNEPVTKITADMLQGVTEIKGYAFYGCTSLESITIPNGVTSIGWDTFCNCGLTEITIPASVKDIGRGAFYNCVNLVKLKFEVPNGWQKSDRYDEFYSHDPKFEFNDPSIAAIYFSVNSEYYNYYWRRAD